MIEGERCEMNSRQYEELCRYYPGKLLGIPVEKMKSVRIPNLRRPGLPGSKSQIDLTGRLVTKCVYIEPLLMLSGEAELRLIRAKSSCLSK